jgi:hypothetical protein
MPRVTPYKGNISPIESLGTPRFTGSDPIGGQIAGLGNDMVIRAQQYKDSQDTADMIGAFSDLRDEARTLLDGHLSKQGSDARGLHDIFQTEMDDLENKYLSERLAGHSIDVQNKFRTHVSSLRAGKSDMLAGHEAQQAKVVTADRSKTLFEATMKLVTDNAENQDLVNAYKENYVNSMNDLFPGRNIDGDLIADLAKISAGAEKARKDNAERAAYLFASNFTELKDALEAVDGDDTIDQAARTRVKGQLRQKWADDSAALQAQRKQADAEASKQLTDLNAQGKMGFREVMDRRQFLSAQNYKLYMGMVKTRIEAQNAKDDAWKNTQSPEILEYFKDAARRGTLDTKELDWYTGKAITSKDKDAVLKLHQENLDKEQDVKTSNQKALEQSQYDKAQRNLWGKYDEGTLNPDDIVLAYRDGSIKGTGAGGRVEWTERMLKQDRYLVDQPSVVAKWLRRIRNEPDKWGVSDVDPDHGSGLSNKQYDRITKLLSEAKSGKGSKDPATDKLNASLYKRLDYFPFPEDAEGDAIWGKKNMELTTWLREHPKASINDKMNFYNELMKDVQEEQTWKLFKPSTWFGAETPQDKALENAFKTEGQKFNEWYSGIAKQGNLSKDPNDPKHFYDYRAAYEAGAKPDTSGHMPSDFKLPGHPQLFIREGGKVIDTRTGNAPSKRSIIEHLIVVNKGPEFVNEENIRMFQKKATDKNYREFLEGIK